MGGAHVVVGADNAALENAEKVFGGVAVGAVATRELAVALDGRLMRRELFANSVAEAGIPLVMMAKV